METATTNNATARAESFRLTAKQRDILRWLGQGWSTEPGPGSALIVNGKCICYINSMKALARQGMVIEGDQSGCWTATELGREVTKQLKL